MALRYVDDSRMLQKDFGTSLSFSGSAGQVTLGTANPFTGSFYFSARVRWAGSNGNFQTIFAKRDSYAADQLKFSMAINTSNVLTMDTVTSFVTWSYTFPVNQYVHMLWVHDTGTSTDKLYINGVLFSSQGIATLGTKATALISIGACQSPGTDFFNGLIDDVTIGTGAPTADEAFYLYTRYAIPGTAWATLRFDEGSGSTATDASGNGNNGTITGATYSSVVPMTARTAFTTTGPFRSSSGTNLNKCINFNASNNVVTFTIPSSWNLSAYSMGFWVNPTSLTAAATSTRLLDYAPAGNGFLSQINANGIIATVKYSVTDAQMTSGAGTIVTGRWQRVIITWTTADNTPHIYINGILRDGTAQNKSGTINSPFPTGSTGRLGNRNGNDRPYAGLMDEFCFWSGVLTQEQVMQDYVAPTSLTTNLITRWGMDESSGSVLDSIGSVNGTPSNVTQNVASMVYSRSSI